MRVAQGSKSDPSFDSLVLQEYKGTKKGGREEGKEKREKDGKRNVQKKGREETKEVMKNQRQAKGKKGMNKEGKKGERVGRKERTRKEIKVLQEKRSEYNDVGRTIRDRHGYM